MTRDPALLMFVIAVVYSILVTGLYIGSLTARRCRCSGACARDELAHGDVPTLPAAWSGRRNVQAFRGEGGGVGWSRGGDRRTA